MKNQTEHLKWLGGRGFDDVKFEVGEACFRPESWRGKPSGRRGLISAAETRLGGFATDLERGNVWYVPPTLYSMMGGSLCAQAELILDGAVTSANIRSLGP